MKKILGIGNALVDIMVNIDSDEVLEVFSLPKGSMQLVDSSISEIVKKSTSAFRRILTSGGSAANTIHGLAMLGLQTGFIGTIGRDETGDFFENEMKNAGISTRLFRSNSDTGTAVALISPDSERTFATHLGAATELNADDIALEYFEGFDILYMEGYLIYNLPLVEKVCSLAKDNKMKIAIDLASFNVVEANLENFREIILRYTDILFANEEEAKSFTGQEAPDALKTISSMCEIAIIKVGNKGSWVRRGDEIVKINPLPVNCIDSTGAGDLYAAGFLSGYAQDLNLEKCGILGSILAGNVIEITGARMNKETFTSIKSVIKDFLREN